MLVLAVVEYFKYKLVSSVIVLACWDSFASIKLTRELSHHGLRSSVSCNLDVLLKINKVQCQGVLIFGGGNNSFLNKVNTKQFARWYKWLVVGDKFPTEFSKVRYDSDISLLCYNLTDNENFSKHLYQNIANTDQENSDNSTSSVIQIQDIYVHPRDGISLHSWATWSRSSGLIVDGKHEIDRIRRRQDMREFPLTIVTPVGLYIPESYNNKSFLEYLQDTTSPEQDSAIRIGYAMSSLMLESIHATRVTLQCILWATENLNSSMLKMIVNGDGDIAGGILRLLQSRTSRTDIITYIWTLRVGFLYIADRDSNSNMFIEPFSLGVWSCCIGIGIVLALSQRITSKGPIEKEGAYMTVLATWLQQDASAAPEGLSGRWTFVVMSVSSMLVHAYYTSAIVSSLMRVGTNGPKTLRELAESRYSLASENYDWMRYAMFEVDSGWEDMEYLKQKKKTSTFYQDSRVGMEMVRQGGTAYHSEYNHVYPYLKTFRDDQICKLDRVDTVPPLITWLLATKHGQWTEQLRIASAGLHERGISQRLLSIYVIKPPQCRASLLAERVNLGDISSLIGFTVIGGVFSILLLGIEIIFAKWKVLHRFRGLKFRRLNYPE